MTIMNLRRYKEEDFKLWNEFVASSKNGTFLLDRNFMDYHADRFVDSSLMFFEGNKLVAVLPANYDESSNTLYSHQGLTYGGLIMSKKITARAVMEIFDLILAFMHDELGAKRFIYKPIPYIYNRYVGEEDLYALYRHGARLVSRGLSSCIEMENRLPFTESRKSGLRKAIDIRVEETDYVEDFWNILNEVLTSLHHVTPVHSIDEIKLLMSRFPERIKLFGAFDSSDKMLAGCLAFDFGNVLHTQYLASTNEGKSKGALDKLVSTLICTQYRDCQYFDFGISTEQSGTILNEGLIFQKEGFGGRGVCYDHWLIEI